MNYHRLRQIMLVLAFALCASAMVFQPLLTLAQTKPSDLTVKRETNGDTREILPAVKNLSIELADNNSVFLYWEEIPDNRIGNFIILRSDSPEIAPTEIARVAGNETSYLDSDVTIGETYTYRIRTFSQAELPGDSDPKSILISANVPQVASSTPAAFTDIISSPLLDVNSDNFWPNLLAINSLVVGGLLILYLLLRSVFFHNAGSKGDEIDLVLPTPSSDNFAAKLKQNLEERNLEPQSQPAVDTAVEAVEDITETRAERMTEEATETPAGPRIGSSSGIEMQVNPKLGNRDINIVKKAKKKYASDRVKKISDWEKAAED